MSEATVVGGMDPGFYVLTSETAKEPTYFRVASDASVWGLSNYNGSWEYRTYGRGVGWFLKNVVGEGVVTPDMDRTGAPPKHIIEGALRGLAARESARPGLVGQYDPASPYEPIKVIEHYNLNFSLGCVIKYVLRAGRKPGVSDIEDLEKARQNITFEIERRKRLAAKE